MNVDIPIDCTITLILIDFRLLVKPRVNIILEEIMKLYLILMSFIAITQGNHGKCNIEDRVRLALRTMNHQTVPQVVDCVVGSGPCDSTGSWIRNHAR